MSIGPMRTRIRLLKPVRTEDELGGASLTWSDQGDVWAEIASSGAREDASFDLLRSRASYRTTIRKRNDIRAGWRIQWGARVFRVLAAIDAPDERTQLDCEEIQ